jgi:hypothetical protein
MFEEEKKLIAQYYAIIKQKTGEDIDIMYDILNEEDNVEPDEKDTPTTESAKKDDSEKEPEDEVDISEDEIELDEDEDDEDEDEEESDEEEPDYEIDLMIGDTSEVLLGIRFFNAKKEIIYDLLRNKEFEKESSSNTKNKSKLTGKEALRFHFENIDFKIDHDFIIYTKNADVLGEVTYAELTPNPDVPELERMIFTVDKDLFKLQVQV